MQKVGRQMVEKDDQEGEGTNGCLQNRRLGVIFGMYMLMLLARCIFVIIMCNSGWCRSDRDIELNFLHLRISTDHTDVSSCVVHHHVFDH